MDIAIKIWDLFVSVIVIVLAAKGAAAAFSAVMMLATWLIAMVGAGAILSGVITILIWFIGLIIAIVAAMLVLSAAGFVKMGLQYAVKWIASKFSITKTDDEVIVEMAV